MIEQAALTPEAIAEKVAKYLEDCHPEGVTLEVISSGIRQNEYAWRVPVRPNREPVKRWEYYGALADVEIALDDNEHLNVSLVTWDPIEQPVA